MGVRIQNRGGKNVIDWDRELPLSTTIMSLHLEYQFDTNTTENGRFWMIKAN